MTTWIVGAGGQDGKILTTELGAMGENLILQFSKHINFPNRSSLRIDRIGISQARRIINHFQVETIYFLAAHSRPSQVRNLETTKSIKSFDEVESLFEVICQAALGARWKIDIFLASSCLIYAGSAQSPQNEATVPVPKEPYALSKVRMSEILYEHSKQSGFIRPVVGIFYNHESTLRTREYLSHKLINHALDIYEGKNRDTKLSLISGSNRIDMSHAEDFISNLIKLMKTDFVGSCIFSSGLSTSIQDFCNSVFKELDLNYQNHVVFTDSKILSEQKVDLVGDNTLLKSRIYQPKTSNHSETITRLVYEWREKRVGIEK